MSKEGSILIRGRGRPSICYSYIEYSDSLNFVNVGAIYSKLVKSNDYLI